MRRSIPLGLALAGLALPALALTAAGCGNTGGADRAKLSQAQAEFIASSSKASTEASRAINEINRTL